MRKWIGCCLLLWYLPAMAGTHAHESWLVTVDLWGNLAYQALELDREGSRLAGKLDGDPLVGEWTGDAFRFTATDARQATCMLRGTATAQGMTGTADCADPNHADRRVRHAFTARRLPPRPEGPPRTIDFTPAGYANTFSPHATPVLTLWPGDTVRTSTIDSGGVDKDGVTRALFGNPQVGPFYVASAQPGDTLAVHIRRLRLNRDYADSLDSLVGPATGLGLAGKAAALGKPVRWRLDREHDLAFPADRKGALAGLSVPVRPMLGGMAVAPGFGFAPLSTGDTGRTGGNMDFNQVIEGNTVYLPVQQPGALLYFGDAHALQGDGETSQYALETSMDVELTVDVIHGRSISMPRVESPTQIMVLGQAGSLDEALRAATSGMIGWLAQDYGLTLSESAQLLGSAMHYTVANLAGRSVGVAALLDKSVLATLRKKLTADAAATSRDGTGGQQARAGSR